MRTRTKKTSASLAAGVALALVLAGCASTGQPEPDQDATDSPGEEDGNGNEGTSEEVTLTFLHVTNSEDRWGAAIEVFEDENPDIMVEEQEASFDDLVTQIQARMSAKDTSLDVLLIDGPRVANAAAQGFLADLSSYKDEIAAQLGETSVTAVTYDGKQWAFPQWSSTNVLYYNKDLLGAAGLESPSADPDERLTWEQTVSAAEQAQAAGAKYGLAFEQIDRYYQLQPLFESSGAGSGLTGPNNLTPDITSPAWIETAEWYANLFDSGLAPRGIPVEQMSDQFSSGNVAYFVGGTWLAPGFADSDVDWGVAPIPYFADGKPVTPTGSWTVAVSAFSEHPEAAKEFASFITLTAEGASRSFPEGPAIQKDALEGYLDELRAEGPVSADLADIIDYEFANTGIPRPATVGYVEFETIMNKAFSDIRNGQDVQATLQSASDQIETAFERY